MPENLSKLTVVVTAEEEKKIVRARDLLTQKNQCPSSLQETLVASTDVFLRKYDPVRKAERATASRTPPPAKPQK